MRTPAFKSALVALALAGTLTGACKKNDAGTPAADSSPTTANTALQVSSIELGRSLTADKRVTASTDDFSTRDTIYASVATTGTGNGTLTANWTFEDGQVVERSDQSVAATGPAITEFHIAKATPWPAGKYRVVFTLDGREVGSKEFEVK